MKRILYPIFAVILLTGCTDKDALNYQNNGLQGEVAVTLIPSGEFIAPASTGTKADVKEVDTKNFNISIKDASGTIIQSWERYVDVPSVVTMEKGSYTLEASSPGKLAAAFDQPIYEGSQSLVIEPSKLTNTNVVCKLSNMKVTIEFSDAFRAEVTDFIVVIHNGSGTLEFTDTTTRAGYFTVGPLTIQVQGRRKLDGSEISQTSTITDVAAQDYHLIRFNAVETGSLQSGITIDYSTTHKDHEILVPGEDEEGGEPGGEGGGETPDPTPSAAPTVTGAGIAAPFIYSDAQKTADEEAGTSPNVAVNITTDASGIAELWVRFDSPDLGQELLTGVFGITTMSVDLANLEAGSQAESMLKTFGLVNPEDPVKGKTSYSFSIGAFVGLLSSGDASTDHKFHVTVKDGNGMVKEATLTVTRTAN